MAQTAGGTYYAASSELVSSWPATSLNLANQLESRFAAKADASIVAVRKVVSTTKTDTFSTSSSSYVDLTGMSVSITPSSSTSKVLVMYELAWNPDNNIICYAQLLRGSTVIGGGTAAGARASANKSTFFNTSSSKVTSVLCGSFLDSPASTSSTTYKIQVAVNSGSLYINRTLDDSDFVHYARTSSTITVLEVLP